MLLKTGKRFPTRDGTNGGGISYAEAIAAALKEELGDTHRATKTVMRWTGAGERTAKNWLKERVARPVSTWSYLPGTPTKCCRHFCD
jgi:hypothetical protein